MKRRRPLDCEFRGRERLQTLQQDSGARKLGRRRGRRRQARWPRAHPNCGARVYGELLMCGARRRELKNRGARVAIKIAVGDERRCSSLCFAVCARRGVCRPSRRPLAFSRRPVNQASRAARVASAPPTRTAANNGGVGASPAYELQRATRRPSTSRRKFALYEARSKARNSMSPASCGLMSGCKRQRASAERQNRQLSDHDKVDTYETNARVQSRLRAQARAPLYKRRPLASKGSNRRGSPSDSTRIRAVKRRAFTFCSGRKGD